MADKRIEVATNLVGPVRREEYMGREHIVVSAVLVKSKVLHNNLGRTYLPPEDITPEWAETANGAPVVVDHPHSSARTPDVMNALGVGVLHRARVQDGALKADVFIDPSRESAVKGLDVILARLEKGEKVEGSTGFPVGIDPTPGAINGKDYDVVIHPLGFDHYATFAEKIGACSVEDGCGLAQNAENGCGCTPKEDPTVENEPEEPTPTAWQSITARLAKVLGFKVNEDGTVALSEPADDPEPAANAEGDSPKEKTMDREQMIAQLAAAGRDRDALAKLTECDLKALHATLGASPAENAKEGDGWEKAREWRQKYESLEAQTQNARDSEEKERADLLDDLLFNAQSLAWTEAEIKGKDIVELRKIHRSAFPKRADYSGRGGPAAAVHASLDWVKPVEEALATKEAN